MLYSHFLRISCLLLLTLPVMFSLTSCDGHSSSTGSSGGGHLNINAPGDLTGYRDSTNAWVIHLNWRDFSNNELLFFIFRSTTNTPDGYYQLDFVPANTTAYNDSAAPTDSVCYYRVFAAAGKYYSLFSNVLTVPIDTAR
ncbi:MAG: hypothetical protein OEM52_03575 [bacterium]|nr:hypothetical protein [bacterium]